MLQRLWVLHRRLIIQAAALFLALITIVGIYQGRDLFRAAGGTIIDIVAAGTSRAGLDVREISMTGLAISSQETVFDALGIEAGVSMVAYDADEARARLEVLPAIKSASVTKVYPTGLNVMVTEREPVARWRIDGVTFLVDASGRQLVPIAGGDEDLPLIVGDGAASGVGEIVDLVSAYPILGRDLVATSRIAGRRWDLLYRNGLRIMLPEQNPEKAMLELIRLDASSQLLERDLDVIDMRVEGQMALSLTNRAGAESSKESDVGH
ncbi:MAG: FtsQ-type POTRA domain-containing protein [Alphaproteobacteria bacterium]|nr:FtsQ-type POTRA domain-containing protein [Alphaproteobacteria bacterium]